MEAERRHQGVAVVPSEGVAGALAAHPTLSAEQVALVWELASSGHGIESVEAGAGAGKTYALRVAVDAFVGAGHPVLGTSTSNLATRTLEQEAGVRALNTTRLAAAPRPSYAWPMGLLRNRTDGPGGERFLMREKLLSIGDDFWIENEQGERAYKVDGKAVRVRQTFVLEDASGDEVARIQERKLSIRDKVAIERNGDTVATIHKALVGIRDRFSIDVEDGEDMKAHGNVVDHEYEIERDGDTVATISKKWFRVRESYGVEVAADTDIPLILAITVAIDSLTSRD